MSVVCYGGCRSFLEVLLQYRSDSRAVHVVMHDGSDSGAVQCLLRMAVRHVLVLVMSMQCKSL